MSKKKGAKKDRQRADDIRAAERKLAEALAEVEDARAKVARRERKLSALLAKHRPAAGPLDDQDGHRESEIDEVETDTLLTADAIGDAANEDLETEAITDDDDARGDTA